MHFEPLFPIKHPALFELYEQSVRSFWTVYEVDLERDGDSLAKLSRAEMHLLQQVLSFFAASDIIVNDNIMNQFYNECVYAEAKQFYAMQLGVESVHTHMYNVLIERYFPPSERVKLFHGIESNPHILNKAKFCVDFMNHREPLGVRLVAYAAIEGIFFCSSFACIYFFKKKGYLPGLTFSNELIARDESLHTKFSCELYKTLTGARVTAVVDQCRIHAIIQQAFDCEAEFVKDMLSGEILGFTSSMMLDYVRHVCNVVLGMLNCDPLFIGVEQPFEFMDMIGLTTKTNFFESRVSEYAKPRSDRVFSLEEDF